MNGKDKIKDKFYFYFIEIGYNNINISNNLIYDYEDFYLNNNNMGNIEIFKL